MLSLDPTRRERGVDGFDEGQQFRQHPRRQSPDLEFVVCIWDLCAGPPSAYSNTATVTSYCTLLLQRRR